MPDATMRTKSSSGAIGRVILTCCAFHTGSLDVGSWATITMMVLSMVRFGWVLAILKSHLFTPVLTALIQFQCSTPHSVPGARRQS